MNPVSFLLNKQTKPERFSSGQVARERLDALILSQRLETSPELMEQMKKEIRDVVRKYMNITCMQMNIQIELTKDVEQGVEHVKTIQIKGL